MSLPTPLSAAEKRYLAAAPKAELHLHLEGSVGPATLAELARRHSIELPHWNDRAASQAGAYRSFSSFVERLHAVGRCIRTSEDYELVVYDLARTLASQNVWYAEVTFTPATHHFTRGVAHDTYFTGLAQGRARALREMGVEINWIFDIPRDAHRPPGPLKRAEYAAQVAIDCRHDGVVALGLSGNEGSPIARPVEEFTSYFEQARAAGLHSTPHAGEHAGPANIWSALRLLGAERIGHGVRAIEDPDLVGYLAEHDVPLEVNPTSNILLGVYPDYTQHPLPRLLEANVPLTVNTDDPSLFNITLREEVCRLAEDFGLDLDAIDQVLLNGIRYSFLPSERKLALEADARAQLRALRKQHFNKSDNAHP